MNFEKFLRIKNIANPPRIVTINANILKDLVSLGCIKGSMNIQFIREPEVIAPNLKINIGRVLSNVLSLIY